MMLLSVGSWSFSMTCSGWFSYSSLFSSGSRSCSCGCRCARKHPYRRSRVCPRMHVHIGPRSFRSSGLRRLDSRLRAVAASGAMGHPKPTPSSTASSTATPTPTPSSSSTTGIDAGTLLGGGLPISGGGLPESSGDPQWMLACSATAWALLATVLWARGPARRRIRRTMLDATTQTEAVPLARSDLLRSTAPALTPDAAVAPTSKRTLSAHAVSVPAPKAQRSAAAPKLPAVAVNPPPAPPPPPGEPAPGAALRLDHALMLEPFRVRNSHWVRFPEIGIDQKALLSRMAEAYRCGGCGHSGPGDMGASNRTVLRASCAACGKWLLLQPVSHDL